MTAWNREGIDWRRFNAVELLWIQHRMAFDYYKDSHPTQVRKYLIDVGDMALLADWDAGRFKETDLSTGGDPRG